MAAIARPRGSVTRNLRLLGPELPEMPAERPPDLKLLFWLGVFAVLLQFFLSYVVLAVMGLPSDRVKLHPATLVVIVGGIWALMRGVPFHRWCRECPGLVLFVFAIPVLALYGSYFTGVSGAAIYPETYWSAGLLALMLEPATPAQKRLLAKLLIAICVLNVLVALYESFTFTLWFPLPIDPDFDGKLKDLDVDFRPNAFFNHPLAAALITSMSVFLLYAMRPKLWIGAPVFGVLLVGLLAYGGRAALGVTLLFTVLMAVYYLFAGILRRNLSIGFMLVLLFGAVFIPLLIWFIATETNIAERIMDTLYIDDSAEVRATQWEIFRQLTLRDWLFGITHDTMAVLKYQIGLGGSETDIENFWILMLLDLGAIGFSVFCVVFGVFLYHLGKVSQNLNGWLLILASLIIDSGSNSLGVKTNDLFIEVAFVVAMSGYAGYVRQPVVAGRRALGLLRPSGGLGLVAAERGRGLRVF